MGAFRDGRRGWRPTAAVAARVLVVAMCVVSVAAVEARAARAELLWSAPVAVDPAPTAAAKSLSWSPALSCASSAWCVLVDGVGRAAVYDGSGWSAPATIDPGRTLAAVSCATPAFCVAVDRAGDALTWAGSAWSAPVGIDPGGGLDSVSCPTMSFCMAVDDRGDAVTFNGSAWSAPAAVTGLGGPVSCSTAGECVAAYSQVTGSCSEPDLGSSYESGMIVWNDGAWGQPSVLTETQCEYRQAVTPPAFTLSCASVSSCVAVDGGGSGWSYDGAGWQPMPANAAALGSEGLACPSAGQCEGGGVSGTEGEDDGSGFGDPQVIWPNHFMVAISCASTAFCAAVDEAGDVALGTAVAPLVTLTVRIVADLSQNQGQDRVRSNGPMPECLAAWGIECSRAVTPRAAVTLTASDPSKVDRLLGWMGGGCAGAGTCTPALESDTTVTAVFASAVSAALDDADPGRDTLRSLRAGGARLRADLPLPGRLTIVWTFRRRVLATGRVTVSAPGTAMLRLRLTRRGRSRLGHARHTLIDWRAAFRAADGRSVTGTGDGYLR
jgi:hypothetical protein